MIKINNTLISKIENAGWSIYSENNQVILTKKVKNYGEIRLCKNEGYLLSYRVITQDFIESFEKKFNEFSLAKRSLERMAFGYVYSLLEK